MNRLNNQRCYLAGAMDRVPDRGVGWRDHISPFLTQFGVQVLNPLNKPTDLGSEDDSIVDKKALLKSEARYDELSLLNTHPCGTLEEIFWANRQKKPILIRMEQGKKHAPDWLFGTIPHEFIFDTWDDILSYLNEINSSLSINHRNRWYFFHI